MQSISSYPPFGLLLVLVEAHRVWHPHFGYCDPSLVLSLRTREKNLQCCVQQMARIDGTGWYWKLPRCRRASVQITIKPILNQVRSLHLACTMACFMLIITPPFTILPLLALHLSCLSPLVRIVCAGGRTEEGPCATTTTARPLRIIVLSHHHHHHFCPAVLTRYLFLSSFR